MAIDADEGEWQVAGQLSEASNTTLLVEIDGARYVYKPQRGERPLWDFPGGTLGRREVAAHTISELLGWAVVPRTRWVKQGPFGPGSLQDWVDGVGFPVSVFPSDEVPEGWLPVISAVDDDDRPLAVAHRDTDDVRRMALFDLLVNNADRKGSHVYEMADGRLQGIDHGLCFHAEPKLRTVLWGFVGEPIPDEWCADVARVLSGPLGELVGLTPGEVAALRHRGAELLADPVFPPPSGGPVIPWPPL